jgi:uncharacterized membrane protein YgaE (UPF0421/DUF939 family)
MGIAIGIIAIFVVSIVLIFLYAAFTGGIRAIFFSGIWEFVILIAVLLGIPWLPVGIFLGAGVSIYKMYKSQRVSKGAIGIASSIFMMVIILLVGLKTCGYYDSERESIRNRYKLLCESCDRKDYELAYTLMTPQYREEHTVDDLQEYCWLVGNLTRERKLYLNHSIKLFDYKACLYPGDESPPGW